MFLFVTWATKFFMNSYNWFSNKSTMDIPKELIDIKRIEYLDKKRIQKLREENEELRQLEQQLRVAYVSKGLADQIAACKQNKEQADRVKEIERQCIEAERLKVLEDQCNRQKIEQEKKKSLRESLQEQLLDTHKKRLQDYQSLVAERDQQNAMKAIIETEEKLLQQENVQNALKTRLQMEEFIEMKTAFKAKEKLLEDEESEKILQYQKHLDEKNRQLQEQNLKKFKMSQMRNAKLGKQLQTVEDEKRQREHITEELLQWEYRDKEDEIYRARLEQEQKKREQTKHDLQYFRAQVLARNEELTRLKKEEIMISQIAAKKEAALDLDRKHDLELQQKRKDHGSALMNMIEENRRKRAEAMAEYVYFYDSKSKEEQERQKMVQAERIRMLRSMPRDVFPYLPKGVLCEADRKYIAMPEEKQ